MNPTMDQYTNYIEGSTEPWMAQYFRIFYEKGDLGSKGISISEGLFLARAGNKWAWGGGAGVPANQEPPLAQL